MMNIQNIQKALGGSVVECYNVVYQIKRMGETYEKNYFFYTRHAYGDTVARRFFGRGCARRGKPAHA